MKKRRSLSRSVSDDRPDAACTGPRSDDPPPVRAERGGADTSGMAGQDALGLAGGDLPDAGAVIEARRHEQRAVGTERHGVDRSGVARERPRPFPRGDLPDLREPVGSGSGKGAAVRAERHIVDGRGMRQLDRERRRPRAVRNARDGIAARCREPFAVGRQSDRADDSGLGELRHERAGLEVPESRRPVGPGRRDDLPVLTERHIVERLARDDRSERPSRGDVPEPHVTVGARRSPRWIRLARSRRRGRSRVSSERLLGAVDARIPDAGLAVGARRHDPRAVRAERDTRERFIVSEQRCLQRPVGQREDARGAVAAAVTAYWSLNEKSAATTLERWPTNPLRSSTGLGAPDASVSLDIGCQQRRAVVAEHKRREVAVAEPGRAARGSVRAVPEPGDAVRAGSRDRVTAAEKRTAVTTLGSGRDASNRSLGIS